jgi:hypothetical protein
VGKLARRKTHQAPTRQWNTKEEEQQTSGYFSRLQLASDWVEEA